jgi:hypothetical protein
VAFYLTSRRNVNRELKSQHQTALHLPGNCRTSHLTKRGTVQAVQILEQGNELDAAMAMLDPRRDT